MTGRLLATIALLLPAGAVMAASLDLPGPFGNAAGCKYLADGIYGDDSVVTLTSEYYETFASYCDFAQVLPMKNGSKVVTMVCGHEGESYQTIDWMRVVKADERDAYTLFSEGGDEWETVRPCTGKDGQGR